LNAVLNLIQPTDAFTVSGAKVAHCSSRIEAQLARGLIQSLCG